VNARMPPSLIRSIDTWAETNAGGSRSEAIRRLVELGLTVSQPAKRTSPNAAAMASDMAAEQIDKISDASTPEAERHARKRRLLKGPEEFRDMRRDHPRAKN
jgi:Arc/MetJ-type ribon-helix-helix transcriptional regulator